MSYPPSPPWIEPHEDAGSAEPFVTDRRRTGRGWLPYVLAGLTVVTTALAGGLLAPGGGHALEVLLQGLGTLSPRHVLAALGWMALAGTPYSIAVMAFFLVHEMGHFVACRRYGVDSTLPYFIPAPPLLLPFGTLGAVIRIKSPIPHRRALFDIGIAGPLAGFVVALPLVVWGTLRADVLVPPLPEGEIIWGRSLLVQLVLLAFRPDAAHSALAGDPIYVAGWLGLLATAMNLIPAGQLDGGHIVYAVAPAWHRPVALASAGFLLALVTMRGLVHHELSAWMVWGVVVLVFGRNHPTIPDSEPLGPLRTILAVVAAVILVLAFMPAPLGVIGGP